MIFHALAAIGDMLRTPFFIIFPCWVPCGHFGDPVVDFGAHFSDFGLHFGNFDAFFGGFGWLWVASGCPKVRAKTPSRARPGAGGCGDGAGNSVLGSLMLYETSRRSMAKGQMPYAMGPKQNTQKPKENNYISWFGGDRGHFGDLFS